MSDDHDDLFADDGPDDLDADHVGPPQGDRAFEDDPDAPEPEAAALDPVEVPEPVYAEAVAALFARQPARMVPDLTRITTLLELLGRPEQTYPSVQLTGTNGKTSTTAMVTSLLSALGLTVGTYTSPHLQDVRERIRVAGRPIARAELVARLDELAPFLAEVDARHPERLTFFEVLTATALMHFADAPVDAGVVEVGMGGTWDATNLVRGEVGVIGPITLDHPQLGVTTEQVAREKVGIVKDGALVVSEAQEGPVARIVAAAAEAHGAQLVVADRDFAVGERWPAVGGQQVTLRGVTTTVDDLHLPLYGAHQAHNAALALVAVEAFFGFAGGLDVDTIRAGFAAVRAPGRLELVARASGAPVLLDGAHNPAGMAALAETLAAGEFAFRNRVVVLGILGDKDVAAMVEAILPVAHHVVVTQPPSSRAAQAEDVAKLARVASAGRASVEVAEDVPRALELASGLAADADVVVVTGSLYTVGAARAALQVPVS